MRIALAQSQVISAQPGAYESDNNPFETLQINLNSAVKDVQQAKSEGADIVCFPEYFLQGILNVGRQYLSLAAKYLEERLQDLAREHEIAITGTVVYGSSEALPPLPTTNPFPSPSTGVPIGAAVSEHPGLSDWRSYLDVTQDCLADTSHFTLLNQAIYIDSNGKTMGRYTKRNLWHPEREYLESGTEEHPVFETPWGKAGFLICWDLSHPAAAQTLADKGADIIFAPAYWLLTDSEPILSRHNPHHESYEAQIVSALCLARAFETETVLIHTNPGGKSSEGFMGGSTAYAPLMGKMGGWDIGDGSVGLRIVDVDHGVLQDARETYKIREDAAIRDAT